MTILEIKRVDSYRDGMRMFSMHESSESIINSEDRININIPEEIIRKGNGGRFVAASIGYCMPRQYYGVLQLDPVYPVGLYSGWKETGLSSFIISHTFSQIYQDSFNSTEISPDTSLLVDTKVSELIKILENRTFHKETFGYMTTIQKAGVKSEKIMQERNWL